MPEVKGDKADLPLSWVTQSLALWARISTDKDFKLIPAPDNALYFKPCSLAFSTGKQMSGVPLLCVRQFLLQTTLYCLKELLLEEHIWKEMNDTLG